jgi:hypothetical protein
MLPTPTAHIDNEIGSPAEGERNQPTLTWTVLSSRGAGGSLHPQFVEWMMGFPPGWTDLDDDDDPPTTSTG